MDLLRRTGDCRMETLLLAALIVFAGYTVFGVTGFGASPITVPVLAHFLPLPFVLSLGGRPRSRIGRGTRRSHEEAGRCPRAAGAGAVHDHRPRHRRDATRQPPARCHATRTRGLRLRLCAVHHAPSWPAAPSRASVGSAGGATHAPARRAFRGGRCS